MEREERDRDGRASAPLRLTAALSLSTAAACLGHDAAPGARAGDPAPLPLARTVAFRPDRVYEVTGIWVKEGKREQLDAYFAEVFPVAASEYGVRPLFALEPASAYAGDFLPDVLFVNEWPSLERFRAFLDDPHTRARVPRRDDATSRLVVTQYRVPEDATVELADGDVVEFGAMWVAPGKEDALDAYYGDVMPIALRNGLRRITPLQPVFGYHGDFVPDRAGLNLWGRLEAFERFAGEAAPHFPRRDAALERLEVTHAFVRFPDASM